jgi:hypothetical protein
MLAASWIVWLGLAVKTSFVITSEIFMKKTPFKGMLQ